MSFTQSRILKVVSRNKKKTRPTAGSLHLTESARHLAPINSKGTPPPLTAFPATKHLVIQGKIMADVYKDFQREPSRAHQCMHESEKDGARCRAMAMQNNYMCYAHRTDDVPTVIENDMFLIDNLDTHEAIQKAFLDVAARLACNHIDLKRAGLLITLLRAASRNLREAATARRQTLREAAGAGALEAPGAPGST